MACKAGPRLPPVDAAPRIPIERLLSSVCGLYGSSLASPECSRLLEELRSAGVEEALQVGGLEVSGARLLGKGWAGFVFAALLGDEPVAVKALHPRSRRKSMEAEAAAWSIAYAAAAAPRIVAWGSRFIAYRLLTGPTLGDCIPDGVAGALALVHQALTLSWLLDLAGLRHGELARPGSHLLWDQVAGRLYIIDYDSATPSRNPGNLAQLVGGLHRVPWLRRCSPPLPGRLRHALRLYKRQGPTPQAFARAALGVLEYCAQRLTGRGP